MGFSMSLIFALVNSEYVPKENFLKDFHVTWGRWHPAYQILIGWDSRAAKKMWRLKRKNGIVRSVKILLIDVVNLEQF